MYLPVSLRSIGQHHPNSGHFGSRREGFVVINTFLLLVPTSNNSKAALSDFPIWPSFLLENLSAQDNGDSCRWNDEFPGMCCL
jgi:hypothetical protein